LYEEGRMESVMCHDVSSGLDDESLSCSSLARVSLVSRSSLAPLSRHSRDSDTQFTVRSNTLALNHLARPSSSYYTLSQGASLSHSLTVGVGVGRLH
jgi:hypothetical protein